MIIELYKNGVFVKRGYNCKDISIAPKGLASGLQYYYIEEYKPDNPDPKQYYLKPLDTVLTDEEHEEYSHFLKAIKEWELVEFDSENIIERLNLSLGNHLDDSYPVWKRTKHLRELNTASVERVSYINSLFEWEDKCRGERDLRENEYLTNGIFPSFEWDEIPV